MFTVLSSQGTARSGVLRTKNATLTTPFFMPVATFGVGKGISTRDYEETGTQCLISNSFLLSLKPGTQTMAKMRGIHSFTNFNGAFFTDSGGFQSEGDLYVKTSNKGVHLKSPFDGKTHILTPKLVMNNQNLIGSDVAMVIDDMALPGASKKRFEQALERTIRWAKECKQHHNNTEQLLFCIVQGGYDEELRQQNAQALVNIGFDGYAIGGCAIGEPKPDMYRAIRASTPHLPIDKPRYLMGVGSPPDIVMCVGLGIDCFDSIYPTMNARHNTIFTFKGPYLLDKAIHNTDTEPLEQGCDCSTCKHHSKAFLRHLTRINESEGKRLRQVHNLRFMQRLMTQLQNAIREGNYEEYKTQFLNDWFKGRVPSIYE